MFESTTVKLTAWYLLILIGISLLFSTIIYQISRAELDTRFNSFSSRVEHGRNADPAELRQLDTFRTIQLHESETRLFFALFYTNLLILVAGGCGSYLLARRSLKPIEESHEAQSRFTSDASHELRTPLAVMKSELEVALRDKSLSKSDMRELLESNLEEVNRLSDLSNVLLKLSKQDFSGLSLTKASLNDSVKAVTKLHKKDGGGRIKLHLESKNHIIGNEASLTELLMILVDNALRYSPEDSPIDIYTKDRSGSIAVEIINQGKGIAPDDLPHVFERFYRGEKSRTSNEDSSGYGLGLSLAKKIADLHDADIKITSIPDKTTSVVIVFKKSA
ncbi:MAG TPA: HAMP domain-containing sensor histidine kinase [Candidatus Saccharimonadales bacterium]